MINKEASMKDVALRAGVSTGTVSHVINNSCNVKEETKIKVNKAIQELSYTVNPTARKLRNGHSKIVGFLISNITHYFYQEIGIAIEEVMNQHGYELFYINSNEDPEKEINQLELCKQEDFAGLIVVPVNYDWKNIEPIVENIPTVFLDRKPIHIRRDVVLTTNTQSCFTLTQQLIKQGAKKLALISPQLDETMKLRIDGFKDCIEQNGLTVDPDCIISANRKPTILLDTFPDKQWEAILDYVINEKKVDAIVSGNSVFAYIALNYFKRHNIVIQKDILFATFDNPFWMSTLGSNFNRIAQDTKKMGVQTAQLLVKRINKEAFIYSDYLIETELIEENE